MSHCSLKTKVFSYLATALITAFFVVSVSAQTDTSRITGTVTDTQGAAVPAASVTITDPTTKFTRTVQTTEDGNYNFSGIPPSTYTL